MTALQVSQADVLLWSKVAFILDSRHGLGTLLYLKCSITPFIFMLLNMIGVGFLLMVDAECIFILRTIAVWERERRFMVFKIINMIAILLLIVVCFFQDIVPSMGECSIPGGIIYLDMKARSSVIAVYCLLAFGEFELLALVLYRGFESHGGWKIENRLLSLLVSSSPQSFFQDFWSSDRVSSGNDGVDLSLSAFMTATPDVVTLESMSREKVKVSQAVAGVLSTRESKITQKGEFRNQTLLLILGFLSLAEELLSYILSFLPYRDILQCTSACRTLRQAYLSSSKLQYIIEMSGQQLLAVPNTDNSIPISKCLQLLRDKAHAWFKVDLHSFKTVPIISSWRYLENSIAGEHFCLWSRLEDTTMIFPVLPKPSQQPIQRNWLPGTLCSVPNSHNLDVFMDPAQNLIAVAYVVDHKTVYINLGALDGDGVHPQAAGEKLFLSENSENCPETIFAKLKCFGRHIAMLRRLTAETLDKAWQLQIWDWKYSTTSSSILSGTVPGPSDATINFCFLGNNRLLVITDNLNLYSIENMSQTPEFLACFLMPIPLILHTQVLIISTKIFFNLDGMAAAVPILWQHWGPSNTRLFQPPYDFKVHINGNRVLQVHHMREENQHSILHLMDFSLLAVGVGHPLAGGDQSREPARASRGQWRPTEAREQGLA
ncbi:hypothetical protein EV424DRAFT_1616975 [Suillus variegatus]|nr:hypothetical protein EV424DRAFT_1616975 [Suillus variegatus]